MAIRQQAITWVNVDPHPCYPMVSLGHNELTHLPLVQHICVIELGHHQFRWWLVAYPVPSHYMSHCCNIVNLTLRNKLQWNLNQNTKLFIHENASENIVCEMAAILSRVWWVKGWLNSMLPKVSPQSPNNTASCFKIKHLPIPCSPYYENVLAQHTLISLGESCCSINSLLYVQ